MLGSPHFIEDCCAWSKEKLESMKTRQLLNHYRSTYSWGRLSSQTRISKAS